MNQAAFTLRERNPDVLTCIANLSNDEVFTPPEVVNQILDLLANSWASANDGANIWSDETVTFLDPCSKSGVFLREITKRLTDGLANEIPDLNERVDHILSKQVYAIAITSLTGLLTRRSLYCSKQANGRHSVADSFTTEEGNVWFERTEHVWGGGKKEFRVHPTSGEEIEIFTRCTYCGASKNEYGRGSGLETHAYAFIHTDDIKARVAEQFGGNMHFDVIIGNPPYQLSDGGGEGASAVPLYHRFVEQAKMLDPKHVVMIIPARWYSGGKGLNEFRESMLGDEHLSEIHDFPETDMVFPGINIRGGVCYFLRSSHHTGPAKIVNYRKEMEPLIATRPVLEAGLSTFIRYNQAISILAKVRDKAEQTFDTRVQSRNPYGIPSNFSDYSTKKTSKTPVRLYRSRRGSSTDREVYIAVDQIKANLEFKGKLKVLVSKASPGGDEYPHAVLGRPFVAPSNSVSTETYLIVDFPASRAQGENLVGYMGTRFFRFLVSLIKNTQNISKGSFAFVPVQDLSRPWTDEDLYAKYGITETEVEFIESMVRPMETSIE